jgi:hypothetical protein
MDSASKGGIGFRFVEWRKERCFAERMATSGDADPG